MIDHYQSTMINQLRQQEMQCEAEQARLALEASSDAKPFYAPLMTTVGQALIELGSSLQERYGEQGSVPSFAPANK